MAKIARIGDQIQHGATVTGTIISSPLPPTVHVGALPVAHLDDLVACVSHPAVSPNKITSSSITVVVNGKGVARVGDTTTCGATIKEAAVHPNVHAGN